jgi:hypothetical protein
MFYLLFVIIFAVASGIFFRIDNYNKKKELKELKEKNTNNHYKRSDVDEITGSSLLGIIFGIISGIFFIIGLSENLGTYTKQIERFETIRMYQCNISLYESRCKALTEEFRINLGNKYPELEKQIFKDITTQPNKNQLLALFNIYPQIKSSTTLIILSRKVQEFTDIIYKEKIKSQTMAQKIRFKNESPWQIIKPTIPEDIRPLVYLCEY